MWTAWIVLASAGELNFTPDRPGVGNSTGTVGRGGVMIEGGVAAAVSQPSAVATNSIIGRIGVDDPVEIRVRAPDITVYDGDVTTGFVGLGSKVGGNLSEYWSASVVPEIAIDTNGGGFFGLINAQIGLTLDSVGLWTTAESVVGDFGSETSAGGGLSVAIAGGGIYANGGGRFRGEPFVGGGGWWALQDAVQLDIGCDVFLGNDVVPVFLLGASFGF